MLGSEAVTNVLLAVATGFTDRALNVIAMSTEVDEEARSILYKAVNTDHDRSAQARRFGDALRSLGAERTLVNECYRVSFYSGDAWQELLDNRLYAFFTANSGGPPLDKWVHYFPIYDRHLARYRGSPVRVLEIGVYRGGGLELLRSYLGSGAQLVGIDIDEAARAAVDGRYQVEIGDQADPDFLRRVSEAHGPFDIVIDDGGHTMRQQIASVETLFPLLAEGATYLVEDCHTSYWPEYADQPPGTPTFVEWVKERIDDLHAFHHSQVEALEAPWRTHLGSLHVYDSVVVLEHERHLAPFSELRGTSGYINHNRDIGMLQLEMLATRDAAVVLAADATGRAAAAEGKASAESQQSNEEIRILRAELVESQAAIGRLRGDLDGIEADLGKVSDELAHTSGDLLGAWGIIQDMRRSTSWRVTGPLRRVKSVLTRR